MPQNDFRPALVQLDRPEDADGLAFELAQLTRVFQVALDLKKVLLAAVGILATGAVWYLLSSLAYSVTTKPNIDSSEYAWDKFGGADSASAGAGAGAGANGMVEPGGPASNSNSIIGGSAEGR